jgi:D-alanyl-D-alanine carboxypeptidase (penicillin-binding protein 5/6)
MKRIFVVLLALLFALQMLSAPAVAVGAPVAHTEGDSLHLRFGAEIAASAEALEIEAVSALLMEESTGTVLYESNADSALPPASVTKIMTLLLVMEAIDGGRIRLTDTVTVSAHAASMGGSQVFLKEGEAMSVEDLLKSVVIASANDAAVALAEYVAGSESAFVAEMNRRAAELGAVTAKFENTNGLDDTATDHVMSARDIAILSRALIAHKEILKYSSIWMDTIRNGAFGLTNTNRLVRFYPGCTGLKTGSTAKAGFCVSVTAERDGLSLICVIMGAPSRDARNNAAQKLLDWGFAHFAAVTVPAGTVDPIPVTGGSERFVGASYPALSAVVPKAEKHAVRYVITCLPSASAPVSAGQRVGEIVYYCTDTVLARQDITADRDVPRVTLLQLLLRLLRGMLLVSE